MSRIHQETRHDSGKMERISGTVRVEHLERDSTDYCDRDSHDRRNRRLLEKSRVAPLDQWQALFLQRFVRHPVPRVWRVLRTR